MPTKKKVTKKTTKKKKPVRRRFDAPTKLYAVYCKDGFRQCFDTLNAANEYLDVRVPENEGNKYDLISQVYTYTLT